MLTNRCEKMHVVLLINQKDYVHYNQQTSTNEIRFTPALSEAEGRYASRSARTSAQKNLFMQNKPNLLNAQMNVNSVLTMDYVNIRLRSRTACPERSAAQSKGACRREQGRSVEPISNRAPFLCSERECF